MEDIFISNIHINKVRHLENVDILLSETERKHLILTGRNGSGKTSVLEDIKKYFSSDYAPPQILLNIENNNKLYENFSRGKFILGYFSAIRSNIKDILRQPNGPKKIDFINYYSFENKANIDFLQLLINSRYDAIEHRVDNNEKEAEKVENWFKELSNKLSELYNVERLILQFDRENYNYNIVLPDDRIFSFTQLSDGYSSIIDIISEILMRMENKSQKVYDLQGIVLIDEIETHLHIDLQKKILPFLTSFFPKIQFIVTTHSPFVLSSIKNAVIFDLEKQERVEDLSGYSLDAIVESYFDSDKYSEEVTKMINEYEMLSERGFLSEEEEEKKFRLKMYFKNLPKTLAPELSLKISQIELATLVK